jgi:hypothetical protein
MFFILLCCMGCVNQLPQQIPQGAYGTITEILGNQMPSPDAIANTPKGQAIETTIHFYAPIEAGQLQLNAQGLYTPLLSLKPVAVCRTDKAGRYRQPLPAGNYSIIVVQKDGWFAHQSQGGIVQPIQVVAAKWTEQDIQVNYRAVY